MLTILVGPFGVSEEDFAKLGRSDEEIVSLNEQLQVTRFPKDHDFERQYIRPRIEDHMKAQVLPS